jgi:rfaE bifunctional protein kinase chain/domain
MVLDEFNCRPEVLIRAVQRFPRLKILVLGDLMLDRFIWGTVHRISPEAPVPVIEIRNETICLGGAANVTANIRSLGGIPVTVGVIGTDFDALRFREEFHSLGASTQGIVSDAKRITTVKTRIIANHQQICRTDREDRSNLAPATVEKVAVKFRRLVGKVDAVVVSDYAKGLLSPTLLAEILPMARLAGKIVCVDPKSTNFSHYGPATIITPNTLEAERASGMTISNESELVAAGRRILRYSGIDSLLVTRGEEGMALFDGKKRITHIPTLAREVFDVTGAGDTVISTLALGLVAGLSLLEAAVLSNIAAGIVVGKLGTASVSPEELIARIG